MYNDNELIEVTFYKNNFYREENKISTLGAKRLVIYNKIINDKNVTNIRFITNDDEKIEIIKLKSGFYTDYHFDNFIVAKNIKIDNTFFKCLCFLNRVREIEIEIEK